MFEFLGLVPHSGAQAGEKALGQALAGGSGGFGVTKLNGKIKQIAETKTVSAIFVISLSGRIKHIVGLRGVQFVNSRNREQFVHGCRLTKRNFLIFCIFLRFVNLKVGSAYAPQGSKPHFSGILS